MHVLVMAKSPVPGRVKTRLCPPCTPAEAAALAEAALADTLEAVAACGASRRVLALDGAPGPWLPPGFRGRRPVRGKLRPPPDPRLGRRRRARGADRHGHPPGHARPTSTTPWARSTTPAPPSGYAADGGWWAIGLRRPRPRRLPRPAHEHRPHRPGPARPPAAPSASTSPCCPTLVDLDTVDDLPAVVAAGPATRTARLAADLGLVPAPPSRPLDEVA